MDDTATGTPHAVEEGGRSNQTTTKLPSQKTLTLTDYLKRPAPTRPSFLVEGLVPADGRIMLIAPAKQGKSTLALQLSAAIGSGTPFFGREVTKGRVLYLQFDNTETMWRDLLLRGVEAELEYGGIHMVDPLLIPNMNQFDILSPVWQAWTRQVVTECDPQLVVVDVFRKIHKADENKSDTMTAVSLILGELTKGRCALVLHHSSKFSESEDYERPIASHAGRGSTVIAGDADGTWFLFKNRLDISSRLDADASVHLRRTVDGFWITAGEVSGEELTKIREMMKEHPGLTARQFAKIAKEHLNISRSTLQRRLKLIPEWSEFCKPEEPCGPWATYKQPPNGP